MKLNSEVDLTELIEYLDSQFKKIDERFNSLEEHRNEFYNLEELMEILEVTKLTLYRWIKDKKITATKVGDRWRVSSEDLQAFLNQRKSRSKPPNI